ncbi:MAG: 50S ribosomal protein L11 methyltransferase [Negativibacillus sp.]
MNWTEVKIYTSTEGIEPLTAGLMNVGIKGFVVEDAADFEQFLKDTTPHWDYIDEELMNQMEGCETNVKLYVADNAQGMEELAAVRSLLAQLKQQDTAGEYGRLTLETGSVDEEDWSTAWQKYYHTVKIGQKLVVRPAWEEYEAKEGEIVLTLNPGMAFGTGTHHTTSLCMELLEKYLTPEDTVLDVGCGSGILAITAALLGAKTIIGCDIDEVAVKVAGENAELNQVGDRISFHQGDLTSQVEGSFQVIVANIVADVIIRLCDDVAKYLAKGGVFIASGIIEERRDDVLAAMDRQGIEIMEERKNGGWVALACKVKG